MAIRWMVLGLVLASGASWADELELYRADPTPVPAKIMLVLDNSRSMSETLDNQFLSRRDQISCPAPSFLDPVEAGLDPDDDSPPRKICVLKRTLSKFLGVHPPYNDASNKMMWSDDYQVGLATYFAPELDSRRASRIRAEIKKLGEVQADGRTHREHLQSIVDGLTLDVYTPLLGSYLEVLEYLHGRKRVFEWAASDWQLPIHIDSVWKENTNKDQFKVGMPVGQTCGVDSNHIVFLTDGFSYQENLGESAEGPNGTTLFDRVEQFVNRDGTKVTKSGASQSVNWGGCAEGIVTDSVVNGPEIQIIDCLAVLADSVVSPDENDANRVSGIRTHTIAFSLKPEDDAVAEPGYDPVQIRAALIRMESWAQNGLGKGVEVNDEKGLADALGSIAPPMALSTSFTSTVPGVGINQGNRFTSLEDLYFSVFNPTDKPFWYGNLKKFRLGVENNQLVLLGKTRTGSNPDQNADGDNGGDGFFDADVFDLWFDHDLFGANVTGDSVHVGGAASLIKPELGDDDERNLYTTNTAGTTTVNLKYEQARNSLRTSVLGASPSTDSVASYDAFLLWLRGADASTNNEWARLTGVSKPERTLYGAPIHSAPVVVNYTSTEEVNERNSPLPADEQENLVFVSTNDGKLYAVDADSGEEKLSFMPEAFLSRTAGQPATAEKMHTAARSGAAGDFIYGLDSTWTVWRQDMDGDGNIDGTLGDNDDDFVHLFGGMRRGGRNYYALDMTEARSGEMEQMFMLEGGKAGSEFEHLGQTWSEPVLALIKYNGKNEVVMIVGGGYDVAYDSTISEGVEVVGRPENLPSMGNGIYFVRAYGDDDEVGEVLWWASASETSQEGNHQPIGDTNDAGLTDAIPSTVKTLDINGDGLVDHIYVADLGGQIHRFDIVVSGDTTTIVHDLVAQLGRRGNNENVASDRRFFYPPSVAVMQDGAEKYVGIAIGSGLVSSPKNESVDERFYFIKDHEPFQEETEETLTSDDLNDEIVELQIVNAAGNAVSGSPSAPTAEKVAAARGFTVPLLLKAEKHLGSPLIINGTVVFTTYSSQDPEQAIPVGESSAQCTAKTGSSALYTYKPNQTKLLQLDVRMPQTLSGNIATLMLPEGLINQGSGESTLRDLQGWGGGPSGAIDLPDVDMGNIRKTRWQQCKDAACN